MISRKKWRLFFGIFLNILSSYLSKFFIALIKVYQYTLSPIIGRQCRYYPTCSNYSIEAFKKYGPFKGLYLTIKRILSCNPWGGHGFDPVP